MKNEVLEKAIRILFENALGNGTPGSNQEAKIKSVIAFCELSKAIAEKVSQNDLEGACCLIFEHAENIARATRPFPSGGTHGPRHNNAREIDGEFIINEN